MTVMTGCFIALPSLIRGSSWFHSKEREIGVPVEDATQDWASIGAFIAASHKGGMPALCNWCIQPTSHQFIGILPEHWKVGRAFLQDGDIVTLTGVANAATFRIGFGDCSGRILPSRQ